MAKKKKIAVKTKKKPGDYISQYPLRYPWDLWFEEAAIGPIRLVKDKDFPCQVHSMGVQIRTAAISRGLTVRVLTHNDTISLEVL